MDIKPIYTKEYEIETRTIYTVPHRKIKIVSVKLPEDILMIMRARNNGLPNDLAVYHYIEEIEEKNIPVLRVYDQLALSQEMPPGTLIRTAFQNNELHIPLNLEKRIAMIGTGNTFEIWNLLDLKEYQSKLDY